MPRHRRHTVVDLLIHTNLAEYFERVASDEWTCIKAIGFTTTRGQVRIVPGTTFKAGTNITGIDMAFLLENEYERRRVAENRPKHLKFG